MKNMPKLTSWSNSIRIRLYFLIVTCLLGSMASAQEPSAILDLESTTQGILIPRMDSIQRTAITNPAEGLLVFDMDTKSFWFLQDGNWTELASETIGLSDRDHDTKVLVEAQPDEDVIQFLTRDSLVMVIDSLGHVGIGTGSPRVNLHIAGTVQTDSLNIPTQAKEGYVFTSDSAGTGSWQPMLAVDLELNETGVGELGQSPRRLAVSNGHAFVIGITDDDMKVFNISQGNPQFLTSFSIGPFPEDIAISGFIAVVLEANRDSLFFLDISNPALPKRRFAIKAPGSIAQACDVDGNIAGIVEGSTNRLYLYDFSNPDSVFLAGSVGIGGLPREIFMSEGYAYIGDAGSLDLKIVDISDPSNPNVTGSILLGQNPRRIIVDNNIAFVLDQTTDELFVVDVSNTNEPVVLDTLFIPGFLTSLDLRNNLLFIGETVSNAIKVVDVSNPSNVSLVGSFTLYPSIQDLVVEHDMISIVDIGRDELILIQLGSGIPTIDLDGNLTQFDQKFDGLVEIRSPDLNDHLRLSRAGIGSVDLSISLDKTLTIENGSFFARGLGAKDSNKGFFWGESSSNISPVFGLVYDGIEFSGDNKLHLKEMIEGDTSTLVTFKLDGKVGIGTQDPGSIPGLDLATSRAYAGLVVPIPTCPSPLKVMSTVVSPSYNFLIWALLLSPAPAPLYTKP